MPAVLNAFSFTLRSREEARIPGHEEKRSVVERLQYGNHLRSVHLQLGDESTRRPLHVRDVCIGFHIQRLQSKNECIRRAIESRVVFHSFVGNDASNRSCDRAAPLASSPFARAHALLCKHFQARCNGAGKRVSKALLSRSFSWAFTSLRDRRVRRSRNGASLETTTTWGHAGRYSFEQAQPAAMGMAPVRPSEFALVHWTAALIA